MINQVYRLKEPGSIEIDFEELHLTREGIIVQPEYLSICQADQRYYMGKRSAEIISRKLPIALIHEGIGRVLLDNSYTFPIGKSVVMIPNEASNEDIFIKENYQPKSRFYSSDCDGFMRNYIALPKQQLILLPEHGKVYYVLCELLSVACNAIGNYQELGSARGIRFGVWGCGSVGYITALVLRMLYPNAQITVVGRNRNKLQFFSFVDSCRMDTERFTRNSFDCCFECVGGGDSQTAINQIIDSVRPQGCIVLMGVSEEAITLNTRIILEKGLILLGASRSNRKDFEKAISLISSNKQMEGYLNAIISQIIQIRSIEDINKAFYIDNNVPFKTILEWRM